MTSIPRNYSAPENRSDSKAQRVMSEANDNSRKDEVGGTRTKSRRVATSEGDKSRSPSKDLKDSKELRDAKDFKNRFSKIKKPGLLNRTLSEYKFHPSNSPTGANNLVKIKESGRTKSSDVKIQRNALPNRKNSVETIPPGFLHTLNKFEPPQITKNLDSEIFSLKNTLCDIIFGDSFKISRFLLKSSQGADMKMLVLSLIDVTVEESMILPFIQTLLDTETIVAGKRTPIQYPIIVKNEKGQFEVQDNKDEFEVWLVISSFVRHVSRSVGIKMQGKIEQYIQQASSPHSPSTPINNKENQLSDLKMETILFDMVSNHFKENINENIASLLKVLTKLVKYIVNFIQGFSLIEVNEIVGVYANFIKTHKVPSEDINAFYFCCILYPLIIVKVPTKRSMIYLILLFILREICMGDIYNFFNNVSAYDNIQIEKIQALFHKFKTTVESSTGEVDKNSLGTQIILLSRVNDRAFLNVTKLFSTNLQAIWNFLLGDPVNNVQLLNKFIPIASVGIKCSS